MIRRDSERNHPYAHEVFRYLNIFDIEGLLKENDTYHCGVEAYQVTDFNFIRFDLLNQQEEIARYKFCSQLYVPYYIIITSEADGSYQIYNTLFNNNRINYSLRNAFSREDFLIWWRSQQSFHQLKPMYIAAARIEHSIIDKDLFANSLAWGVNIDGFIADDLSDKVTAIIEKRICTHKPPYTVQNYDPDKFFHGTANRSGDYPAWHILFELSKRMNVNLILFTFDTSMDYKIGAARIIDVNHNGITYAGNIKPNQNIIRDNIEDLKLWLKANV